MITTNRCCCNHEKDYALSLPRLTISIEGSTRDHLKASLRYRRRAGLLVNDSLTAAAMEIEGVSNLATADPDFARVETIQVYSPQDLDKA